MLKEHNLTLKEFLDLVRRIPFVIRDAHKKWHIRIAVAVVFVITQYLFRIPGLPLLTLIAWVGVGILVTYIWIRVTLYLYRYSRALLIEIVSKMFDKEVLVEN